MTDVAADSPSGRRLALTLGYWIMPAIAVAMASTLWFSATTIRELADSAYDRSLAGAIRAIDANISTESGGVGVELPYNLFSFFQLTAQGAVYFNVSTSDGLVQIGDVLLPKAVDLASGQLRFEDSTYLGEDIRIGALKRPLDPSKPDGVQIIIQVAESKLSRSTFQNELIARAILRDFLVVLILGVLIIFGVFKALRPLHRLQQAINAREPDDLQPVAVASLPMEVTPLVQAMNRMMQRTAEEAEQQRRFLDDASHQLRTPMTIMRTQIEYALRNDNVGEIRETLQSIGSVLDRSIRTTNQLLALAKARTAHGTEIYPLDSVELSETIADTIRMLWPRIRSKKMDCVFDAPDPDVIVRMHDGLLREGLVNIIDNAVKYAPEGSLITVSLLAEETQAVIVISDEGPGMEEDELRHAVTRFRSGKLSKNGSGLGLAIALTVARANGGTMTVRNRTDKTGLMVRIELLLAR